MYQKEDIKSITRKMTKYFSSPVSLLSKESGLSLPTVSKFFNGNLTIRPSNTELLYDLSLELIEEKTKKIDVSRKKEEELTEKIKKKRQLSMKLS